MTKKLLPHLFTFAIAFWAILLLVIITRYQLELFHHALYVRQNRLNVDWVITDNLITKLTASVILCVLGLGCYLIHLLAVEQNQFLSLSRLCFLSSGLISCTWEVNTMFVISRNDRLFWIKNEDLFLILFFTQALITLFIQIREHPPKAVPYLILCSSPFIAAALINQPMDNIFLLRIFLCLLFSSSLFFFVSTLIKQRKQAILFFYAGSIYILLGYLARRFFQIRLTPSLVQTGKCLPKILFLMFAYIILSFFFGFRQYRSRIFYNRTFNLRMQEVDRFKNETVDRIQQFTQPSLNKINGLCEILMEENCAVPDRRQKEILQDIQTAARQLSTLMENMHTYNLIHGNAVSLDMMKVSFDVIFESALDMLNENGLQAQQYIDVHFTANTEYIFGDPYYLMQVNYHFLLIALELRSQDHIRITTCREENRLCINMEFSTDNKDAKKIHRIQRILNQKNLHNSDYLTQEDELSTIIARNLLLRQGGALHASSLADKAFKISYSIPIWNELSHPELSSVPHDSASVSRHKVILISTLPEQIDLIRTYLEFTPYSLFIFNTAEDALQHIEGTRNIGILLIGTTFLRMSSQQICTQIRKNHSMGQVPVILIWRDELGPPSDPLLSQINDIILEPFSRKEFLWKLDCASYLKSSVSMALKSRINFLQSQMDPHFLFNALNTIMPLCLEDPEKAYDLLESFGEYLRGSLFAGELQKSVSISRELELVQAYLKIQTARFHNMISYDLNISCNTETMILPLIIEPIVENCIKHGRRGTSLLTIQIDVIQDENWIYIQIKDDGIGMTPEKIALIKEMKTDTSIGLANLIKRLKLYYHESLNISSRPNTGTLISYKIPAVPIDFD